jgi:hypothetical protein
MYLIEITYEHQDCTRVDQSTDDDNKTEGA